MKKEISEGEICGNERGYAFFIPKDEGKGDYFISHSDLRGALHKDVVLCETTVSADGKTTGRVLKILKRGVTKLTGVYFSAKTGGYVRPDDNRFFCDVKVPFGKGLHAHGGDKVICRILSYGKTGKPEGIVTDILGRQFERKAELKAIEFSFGLEEKFNGKILKETEDLPDKISEEDIKGRLDLRGERCFTIDGDDAKDFDDAVSIKRAKDGYILGVHIADVSHFVKEGGEIDREALKRGTSVYFPEKVISMLPEKLCNDLCSLKEGVDRLTLSCIMKLDKDGKVISGEIKPSVINSVARTTYSAIQKILDGEEVEGEKYSRIKEDVFLMNELCDKLIKLREARGSVDFELKESNISVDCDGEITVTAGGQNKAMKIIEEFMILANVTVAEFAFYLKLPFVYRVHKKPDAEKVKALYEFLSHLGIKTARNRNEVFPADFQAILKAAENTPVYPIVNRVSLRSMQKAEYSDINLGHFGLALGCYCHFTSPIRRYPDLFIHRILKQTVRGETQDEKREKEAAVVGDISSDREKNAFYAERAVDDFYKMLYMSGKIGEEYPAVISGVMPFGIFAETPFGVEGIIKKESFKSGRYTCDKQNYTVTCGKESYKLGGEVKVRVKEVDFSARKVEFVLVKNNKKLAKNV